MIRIRAIESKTVYLTSNAKRDLIAAGVKPVHRAGGTGMLVPAKIRRSIIPSALVFTRSREYVLKAYCIVLTGQ